MVLIDLSNDNLVTDMRRSVIRKYLTSGFLIAIVSATSDLITSTTERLIYHCYCDTRQECLVPRYARCARLVFVLLECMFGAKL